MPLLRRRLADTRRILLASFLVNIIAMEFGMPRALFPQIATESLGDPASGGTALGLLLAAMSVGAVLGGVFSGWTLTCAAAGAEPERLSRSQSA